MFKERLKTHHSAMSDAKQYAMGPRNVVTFLAENQPKDDIKEKGTIYIHIPFCAKICSFCNMRRRLQKPREDYHELVIKEILAYSQLQYIQQTTFDAIYFGGGTPTTLSASALEAILKALHENLNLSPNVEISVETTVTELTEEKIKVLYDNGVNRLSVGVQTFQDRGRKLMNRIGSGKVAYDKLKQLKDYGFKTISMDLIYNYPDQTIEELEDDLSKICELNLDGFSMYSLIDMKETTIDEALSLEEDYDRYMHLTNYMERRGYHFLELTKMVKTDQYRYVMNRHLGADTLPLGAGAGGTLGGLMLMNEFKLEEYERQVSHIEEKQGMLFASGYKELARFKGSIQSLVLPTNISIYTNQEAYQEVLQQLLDHEYVNESDGEYHLTVEGVFWGNNISRRLYDLIMD